MTTSPYFDKDPDAVLEYKFDWRAKTNDSYGGTSDWLAAGETITAGYSVTPGEGLSVDSHARTDSNTSVTVWLSGGTVGATYGVLCRIVTNAGRTDDRTIWVKVVER